MRKWSRPAIALTAISAAAAAVILLVLGLYSVFLVCCRRKNAGVGLPESQLERPPVHSADGGEKRSPEGSDGGEMTWLRIGRWGRRRPLFAIKEEEDEDEMTESEDGRTRGGRRSSRRSQDSGGMSPSTGTTPFLTPLSGSPYSTPPSTPAAPSADVP